MPRARHANVEVHFDEEARRDYLTGFHKRKVARTDAAKKRSQDKEKQEHLKFRKEQRYALKEQAKRNAKEVESAYGGVTVENASDDESESPIDIRQDDYEDEQVFASVTVQEDFDPHPNPIVQQKAPALVQVPKVKPQVLEQTLKPKVKSPKFRYQTKAARSVDLGKQRRRRTEKAELAGGKASKPRGKGKRR